MVPSAMIGSRHFVLLSLLLPVFAGCEEEKPALSQHPTCTSDAECTNGTKCFEWSIMHERVTGYQCDDKCCAMPSVDTDAKARRESEKKADALVDEAHCKPVLKAISDANDQINAIASAKVTTAEESKKNAGELDAAFVANVKKLKALKITEPKLNKPLATFMESFEQQAAAAKKLKAAVDEGGAPAELGERLKAASDELGKAQAKSNEALEAIAKLCTALVVEPVAK